MVGGCFVCLCGLVGWWGLEDGFRNRMIREIPSETSAIIRNNTDANAVVMTFISLEM